MNVSSVIMGDRNTVISRERILTTATVHKPLKSRGAHSLFTGRGNEKKQGKNERRLKVIYILF